MDAYSTPEWQEPEPPDTPVTAPPVQIADADAIKTLRVHRHRVDILRAELTIAESALRDAIVRAYCAKAGSMQTLADATGFTKAWIHVLVANAKKENR